MHPSGRTGWDYNFFTALWQGGSEKLGDGVHGAGFIYQSNGRLNAYLRKGNATPPKKGQMAILLGETAKTMIVCFAIAMGDWLAI